MENGQKLDGELRLALDAAKLGDSQEGTLQTGYDEEAATWRVIVRYNGDLSEIEEQIPQIQAIPLYHGYGIVRVPEALLGQLAALPQIQYMEKPKEVYFSLDAGRSVSCINSVQGNAWQGDIQDRNGLTGKGVIVGIADSGFDITHPAFRNEDGTTRILALWEQNGTPDQENGLFSPEWYRHGAEWTQEQINKVLDGTWQGRVRPFADTGRGHGTAVAGVAAGNGAGSQGRRYRGVAVESPLLLVKLGTGNEGFSRTTEVMEALDYIVRTAQRLQMPVSVNLSYGNNNGAHNGQSLFEGYISELAGVWKSVIVIASGNEGDARHHARVQLQNDMETVRLVLASGERSLSMQLWKQYVDDFTVFLEAPDGRRQIVEADPGETRRYQLGGTQVLVYYGEPSPESLSQEIYFEWIPAAGEMFLPEGVWSILFLPEKIIDGRVELWLPTIELIGLSTGFLNPSPDTTLTIPSTADRIITVGAYNSIQDTVASFSGRGNTVDGRSKPTIVAPGVDVVTAAPGGGYTSQTGTSISAPFVTGSAALMMEWGIVQDNDAYLYGEKVKAYLMKGARRLPGQQQVPDTTAGWGALCLRDSLPVR